jgi:hypothetical protein
VIAVAAVHAALVLGSWLGATLLYALLLTREPQLGWALVDAALVGACVWLVHRRQDVLGFRSLGARRGAKLVGILAFATLCALIVQIAIRDRNGVWLDETHYLMTVRAGEIIREGRLPYNLRWLVPFFAGRWNILPVDDMDALKAINFGAFAVTGAFLVLLLVRLRVRLGLALAAPVFLLSSYLGIYGASNRLVLDPFNYALYVVLFHLAIRREHWPMFAAALFVEACNAEKAIYWVPVIFLVIVLRDGSSAATSSGSSASAVSGAPAPGLRWRAPHRHPLFWPIVWCCVPTVVYLAAIRLYLAGSVTEWNLCFENIDVMSFSALGADIKNQVVAANTFQSMWLPFGPFTIYALLGFTLAERWMKPLVLLLIPIFVQNLIACDGDRMVAYAFIVYLPFGYLYLSRALGELPRPLARLWFGLAIALTVAERYLLPVLRRFRSYELPAAVVEHTDFVMMMFSAAELTLVGTLLFVHFTWFAARARARAPSP